MSRLVSNLLKVTILVVTIAVGLIYLYVNDTSNPLKLQEEINRAPDNVQAIVGGGTAKNSAGSSNISPQPPLKEDSTTSDNSVFTEEQLKMMEEVGMLGENSGDSEDNSEVITEQDTASQGLKGNIPTDEEALAEFEDLRKSMVNEGSSFGSMDEFFDYFEEWKKEQSAERKRNN